MGYFGRVSVHVIGGNNIGCHALERKKPKAVELSDI